LESTFVHVVFLSTVHLINQFGLFPMTRQYAVLPSPVIQIAALLARHTHLRRRFKFGGGATAHSFLLSPFQPLQRKVSRTAGGPFAKHTEIKKPRPSNHMARSRRGGVQTSLCVEIHIGGEILSVLLPAIRHAPRGDNYAMSAAGPADHDTSDPIALSFGALERNIH